MSSSTEFSLTRTLRAKWWDGFVWGLICGTAGLIILELAAILT